MFSVLKVDNYTGTCIIFYLISYRLILACQIFLNLSKYSLSLPVPHWLKTRLVFYQYYIQITVKLLIKHVEERALWCLLSPSGCNSSTHQHLSSRVKKDCLNQSFNYLIALLCNPHFSRMLWDFVKCLAEKYSVFFSPDSHDFLSFTLNESVLHFIDHCFTSKCSKTTKADDIFF